MHWWSKSKSSVTHDCEFDRLTTQKLTNQYVIYISRRKKIDDEGAMIQSANIYMSGSCKE